MFTQNRICVHCTKAIRQQQTIREAVSTALHANVEQSISERKFTRWYNDNFDRPMFSHIRNRVYSYARLLHEMGFAQHNLYKPWVLSKDLGQFGIVYADFGSTKEVPIWDDTAALVYVYPEEERELILPIILDELCRSGIEVRTSFYESNSRL